MQVDCYLTQEVTQNLDQAQEYRELRYKELLRSETRLQQTQSVLKSTSCEEDKLLGVLQEIMTKQDRQRFYISRRNREVHTLKVMNLDMQVETCLSQSQI